MRAQATVSDVRVTIMRDGSTTYHFFETEDLSGQQTDSGAVQGQPAVNSNSVVSFETSPAIAAYLADRQLQSKPEQRSDGASSWSRQLAQLQRGNARTKHRQQTETRPRPHRTSASSAPSFRTSKTSQTIYNGYGNGNGDIASDTPTSMDSTLDFDESGTELLLRAYSSRAAAGRLDAALHVLEGVIKAGRIDVLRRSGQPQY